MMELRQVKTTQVSQLHAFELLLDALIRVQFGSVSWEAFNVQPLRRAIRQEVFADVTAVNRRAIPDDHYVAGHLAQQVFETATTSSELMEWSWLWK